MEALLQQFQVCQAVKSGDGEKNDVPRVLRPILECMYFRRCHQLLFCHCHRCLGVSKLLSEIESLPAPILISKIV